jgi:pimeloyl-ACP methyl ester carboxylesterase
VAVKTVDVSSVESLELAVNGRRTHYLKAGSGPPVVLLHGGASDSRDWLETMTSLARRFTFYAPDLPGFGENERNPDGYYLTDFIESVEDFIAALGLADPDIAGHSFGGRVGAGVAMRGRVKIRRLVLIDAAGLGKVTWPGWSLMTFFWVLRRILRKPQPFPRFRTREGEDTNWLFVNDLPGLKSTVLLVWQRFDPYFPVSSARRAVRLIPGAKLEVFPGFGHAPNKQHNERFNRLLLDFLDLA